jgi:hypothetical protein
MEVMNTASKAIFGKRFLQHVFAEDYIDWAYEMLLQDYDSPSLRILAGLNRPSNFLEISPYFLDAIEELKIEIPEPKAAIRDYACDLAQQIVDGQFTSIRGVVGTLYKICRDLDYDPEYTVWADLDDLLDILYSGGIPYDYPSATLENMNEIIKKEAADFIARIASCSQAS